MSLPINGYSGRYLLIVVKEHAFFLGWGVLGVGVLGGGVLGGGVLGGCSWRRVLQWGLLGGGVLGGGVLRGGVLGGGVLGALRSWRGILGGGVLGGEVLGGGVLGGGDLGVTSGGSWSRWPQYAQESLPQSEQGATLCGRVLFFSVGEVISSSIASDVASCVSSKDDTWAGSTTFDDRED